VVKLFQSQRFSGMLQ